MKQCECGCGGAPTAGDFLPGHDQRLRSDLEQHVGGLLALRHLVRISAAYANGEETLSSFSDEVRRVFARASQRSGSSPPA